MSPPGLETSHDSHAVQPVGHFLPAEMARDLKQRIMQAEALWRAGSVKLDEIAARVERHEQVIYRWAREYHWPPRADVVAVARQALNLEVLRKAAARAQSSAAPAAPPVDETSSQSASVASRAWEKPEAAPAGTIDFAAERQQRPMSEDETRRQAIAEQAAADALANETTQLFVRALSGVVENQQQMANELAAWGSELIADARALRTESKEKLAELRRQPKGAKKDSTRALNEGIGHFARIAAAMRVVIELQRKVWMLDAGGRGAGAGEDGDDKPIVPVNAGSYEDYVHAAERANMNLTPP